MDGYEDLRACGGEETTDGTLTTSQHMTNSWYFMLAAQPNHKAQRLGRAALGSWLIDLSHDVSILSRQRWSIVSSRDVLLVHLKDFVDGETLLPRR